MANGGFRRIFPIPEIPVIQEYLRLVIWIACPVGGECYLVPGSRFGPVGGCSGHRGKIFHENVFPRADVVGLVAELDGEGDVHNAVISEAPVDHTPFTLLATREPPRVFVHCSKGIEYHGGKNVICGHISSLRHMYYVRRRDWNAYADGFSGADVESRIVSHSEADLEILPLGVDVADRCPFKDRTVTHVPPVCDYLPIGIETSVSVEHYLFMAFGDAWSGDDWHRGSVHVYVGRYAIVQHVGVDHSRRKVQCYCDHVVPGGQSNIINCDCRLPRHEKNAVVTYT